MNFDQDNTAFDQVFQTLKQGKPSLTVAGLPTSAQACFVSIAATRFKKPILVVCPNLDEAEKLASDLRFFLEITSEESNERRRVFLLPPYEVLPFQEISPPIEVASRRVEALYALLSDEPPTVVVTTPSGLLQKTLPRETFNRQLEYVVAGEEVDRDQLVNRLIQGGYYRTQLVEQRGDFSVRGGILDFYPPLAEHPIRLEFFGDFVDSIRSFNVLNQRSFDQLDEWIIVPVTEVFNTPETLKRAKERLPLVTDPDMASRMKEHLDADMLFSGAQVTLPLFYETTENVSDYLPEGSLLLELDPGRIEEEAREAYAACKDKFEHMGAFLPYDSYESIRAKTAEFQNINLVSLLFEDPFREIPIHQFRCEDNLDIKSISNSSDQQWEQRRLLLDRVREWVEMGMDVVWACSSSKRAAQLQEFFTQSEVEVIREKPPFRRRSVPRAVRLYVGRLTAGFKLWSERLILITDEEFLGARQVIRTKRKPSIEAYVSSFEDLNPGDPIVHMEHGIGRYQGLVQMDVDGGLGEFLLIEYEGQDRLYIPIYRLKAIQKYAGIEGHAPKLDRLGGKTWARVKQKIKASVERIAGELVEIYAARNVRKGFAFTKSNGDMTAFAESFAYEETPDQARAIEDVFADMESSRPMDRLVCGDVGFGKTEVALRAAFKTVLDGKQVCYLVPTTVLAEQHLETFIDRFKPYPVVIESLSRFKTRQEQRKVVEGLATGRVDIVIGTHRLLQKDIVFRDLGLLIVDEEQRFGVGHKEKIKQFKKLVDVLTLTATPIPRTLHMGLMGIRDLSTIETPPRDRLSIKTYLAKYDDDLVKEAIMREIRRGGQIFFVHNQVKSIENMASHIRRLVPQARVGVAHGQLKGIDLERVMLSFLRQELDVLMCSTIIESGLDIPTANTIIINRAERFGLAQIYQLRGRAGRSRDRAYAYLLVPSENAMTPEAQKRLKVLTDFTELGSGFKIAFHDLQIRGGGEILGASQSGHIAAVGYEMYLEFMQNAVNELKGKSAPEEIDPEIHLSLPAFLPETYISSIGERLSLYKKLSSLTEAQELVEIRDELRDRFGAPPKEAENLLDTFEIRNHMRYARIQRLDWKSGQLIFSFDPDCGADVDGLLNFVKKHPKRARIAPEGRLFYRVLGQNINVIQEVKKVLQEIV